jgi:hypothetical protein
MPGPQRGQEVRPQGVLEGREEEALGFRIKPSSLLTPPFQFSLGPGPARNPEDRQPFQSLENFRKQVGNLWLRHSSHPERSVKAVAPRLAFRNDCPDRNPRMSVTNTQTDTTFALIYRIQW